MEGIKFPLKYALYVDGLADNMLKQMTAVRYCSLGAFLAYYSIYYLYISYSGLLFMLYLYIAPSSSFNLCHGLQIKPLVQ